MKFLCVGYFDHAKMSALSKGELDAVLGECPPFMEEFYASGTVSVVAGTPGEAKTLRRVEGKVEVTEGRIGGSPDAIGCIFLIDAADLSEAIRIAALHPTTRIGAGEKLGLRLTIAPVHHFEERALKKA